jgi:hypothetical protein
MGSVARIYVPSFIEIGSGIQKLIGGIHRHTQTATWSHKPTLFFQNKESRLKKVHDVGNGVPGLWAMSDTRNVASYLPKYTASHPSFSPPLNLKSHIVYKMYEVHMFHVQNYSTDVDQIWYTY